MALNLLRLLKQPVSHSRQLVCVIERSHVLHAVSAIQNRSRLKADHVSCVSLFEQCLHIRLRTSLYKGAEYYSRK